MVSYRSGRQGETLAEHTIRWPRKPRTQQERIEEWLGSSDLHELLAAAEALEKQEPEASSLLRSIVHHDAQKCSAEKKQLRLGVTLTVLVSLAILCWYAASPGIAGSAAACLLMGVWMASPCTLSWYKNYKTHARRLSHAVALLHRIPLPATAAEMIEALDAGDSRTASLAARSSDSAPAAVHGERRSPAADTASYRSSARLGRIRFRSYPGDFTGVRPYPGSCGHSPCITADAMSGLDCRERTDTGRSTQESERSETGV